MSGGNKNEATNAPQASEPAVDVTSTRELVIELGTEQNQDVMFNPLRKRFRGRYDRHLLPPGSIGGENSMAMRIDQVPGIYVTIDLGRKRARIVDPLSLPENKALMAHINKCIGGIGTKYDPVAEEVHENMSDKQIATWIYWMARLVKKKYASVVSGSFPDRLPSRGVKVDFFNTSQAPRVNRYLEQFQEQRETADTV